MKLQFAPVASCYIVLLMFSGLCRCEEQEVDYSEILKSQFQMKGENDARWNCIMEAFNLPHFQDNLKLKSIDPSNIKKINTEINRYIIKAKKQICPRSHFEVKRRSADPSMIRLIPAKHHTAAVEETEDALSYNAKVALAIICIGTFIGFVFIMARNW